MSAELAIAAQDIEAREVLNLAANAEINNKIEVLEETMLALPQVDQVVHHTFSKGIYMRHLEIPKGCVVIGHQHKTEHINMLIKGEMTVVVDGSPMRIKAPFVVSSLPGTRKIGYAHEDSIWVNVHATDEKDLNKLEEDLIIKSETFKRHELECSTKELNCSETIELKTN